MAAAKKAAGRRAGYQGGDLPPGPSKVTRGGKYVPTRGVRDAIQPGKSRRGKVTAIANTARPNSMTKAGALKQKSRDLSLRAEKTRAGMFFDRKDTPSYWRVGGGAIAVAKAKKAAAAKKAPLQNRMKARRAGAR